MSSDAGTSSQPARMEITWGMPLTYMHANWSMVSLTLYFSDLTKTGENFASVNKSRRTQNEFYKVINLLYIGGKGIGECSVYSPGCMHESSATVPKPRYTPLAGSRVQQNRQVE